MATDLNEPTLILASSSRYRAELLARLGIPFRTIAADIDETAQQGESVTAMAHRLATAKARAVASKHPGALVLGSDQVAEIDGAALGKPGTMEAARAQLQLLSGRVAHFHTAVCLFGNDQLEAQHLDTTRVHLRSLDEDEIQRYLAREPALDCAGSFRCEQLGIALMERIESDDPTALIGLPLIAVATMLRAQGLLLP